MIVDTMVTALLLLPLVWGETVEEVTEEVLNCTGKGSLLGENSFKLDIVQS